MNILNKLTIRHLKLNKKRTLVTILGIVLSTALMVGIGCLVATMRDYSLQQIESSSGDYHVQLTNVNGKDYSHLSKNIEIRTIRSFVPLGYSPLKDGKNNYKPYLQILAADDQYLSTLKLIKGQLPKNNSEIVISSHIQENGGVEYKIGDTIELILGDRYIASDKLNQENSYTENEIFREREKKTYKVVGIIERDILENYSAPGYQIYTRPSTSNFSDSEEITSYLIYKKIKDVHGKTDKIVSNLKNQDQVDIDYNNTLLSFYGQSSYKSINNTLGQVLGVALTILAIACAIVIYNSFAISVMERKKQFGLFSSIGATRRQIHKTVFFEAVVVGGIGLFIGTLGGIVGVWALIQVTNMLLPNVFDTGLRFSIYPSFLILPIIYMVITIFVSAFLPARSAAKISPIEAIRLNDDIKVKKKKVKTSKWVRMIFGIEGELALKNLKRSKKKYRITIISLIISIILFISFSSFFNYGNSLTNSYLQTRDYDISISSFFQEDFTSEKSKNIKDLFNDIKNFEQVEDSVLTTTNHSFSINIKSSELTESFVKELSIGQGNLTVGLHVYVLDEESYKSYIKTLGFSYEDFKGTLWKPILLNKVYFRDYENQTVKEDRFFVKNKSQNLTFTYLTPDPKDQSLNEQVLNSNVIFVNKPPKFFKHTLDTTIPTVFISKTMYDALPFQKNNDTNSMEGIEMLLEAKEHKQVADKIDSLIQDKGLTRQVFYTDMTEEMNLQNNLKIVIGLFLYGFITLVTLIGVTSVFNTINTSMALRAKEFAVLRSIGLTNKGMNKMLRFESIFYGLKALLYGIPLSIGVIFLIHRAFSNMYTTKLLLPVGPICIAVVAVFFITFLTMSYATRKIKKENIIDTIREENI